MLQGLHDAGAIGAHIEAHTVCAFSAKHLAIVERKTSPVHKEVDELIMVEIETGTIEPHKERCLRANRVDAREIVGTITLHSEDILLYVFLGGGNPTLGSVVCRFGGACRKE